MRRVYPGLLIGVNSNHRPITLPQPWDASLNVRLREHYLDAGVVQHKSQALFRIDRRHRHIGAPGLEDGDGADDHVDPPRQAEPHIGLGLEGRAGLLLVGLSQFAGEPVGARVQLRVSEGLTIMDDRGLVRLTADLFLEKSVESLLPAVRHASHRRKTPAACVFRQRRSSRGPQHAARGPERFDAAA